MTHVEAAREPRVVIVDDTPDLRELLRIALTRGGFVVVGEAGDGRTGIDVVREHRPGTFLPLARAMRTDLEPESSMGF